MQSDDLFTPENIKIFELKFCRAEDSVSTELDGETVILDIASGLYSGLDPIGTFIWNQLKQPVTIATLRDRILEKYEVTEDQCVADLLVFLKKLVESDLLKIKNE